MISPGKTPGNGRFELDKIDRDNGVAEDCFALSMADIDNFRMADVDFVESTQKMYLDVDLSGGE